MNFGKHCIIIVSLTSYLFFLPVVVFASEKKSDYSRALKYAQSKILKAEKNLEKSVLKCEGKKHIDSLKIKKSLPAIPEDITGKKMANAIFFLSSRNFSQCIRQEEANLVFAIYSAQKLIERAKDEGIALENLKAKEVWNKTHIITPPAIALQEVEYMTLPENIRNGIEEIEEFKAPFDGIKLLQELKILP